MSSASALLAEGKNSAVDSGDGDDSQRGNHGVHNHYHRLHAMYGDAAHNAHWCLARVTVHAGHQFFEETALDWKTHGRDEIWNQLLMNGKTPAMLLSDACAGETAGVPIWWDVDKAVRTLPFAQRNDMVARRNALREQVWGRIQTRSAEALTIAEKADKVLTPLVKKLAKDSHGETVGLQCRIKGIESLERKFMFGCCTSYDKPLDEVLQTHVTDIIRYTIVFADEKYVEAAYKTVQTLTDETDVGCEVNEIRNYWEPGQAYKGINSSFQIPNRAAEEGKDDLHCILLEIQLHTKHSFKTKQHGTHELYELWRTESHLHKKYIVFQKMVERFDSLATPTPVRPFPCGGPPYNPTGCVVGRRGGGGGGCVGCC
jgi:hypothetical protein